MTDNTKQSESTANPGDQKTLESCPPLAELDASSREEALQSTTTHSVAKGEDILRQGEVGDSFCVLLSGRVEIVRREEDETEVRLVEMEPGAYFGEQALLGSSTGYRTATVRALETCRYASIPKEVFTKRIAKSARSQERFEADAAKYVYREIRRSIEAFS